MTNSKIGIALVAVLVIAIGAYLYTQVEKPFGAVTGPDSYFDYVANNDLQRYGQTKPLTQATTTVCAIKGPAATSTLIFAGVNFVVSSSTASTVTFAKASTAFATTTSLSSTAVGAGAQGTIVFATSTTATTGLNTNFVFGPSTYFVVGMAGGTGTFSPTGSCSAEFERI